MKVSSEWLLPRFELNARQTCHLILEIFGNYIQHSFWLMRVWSEGLQRKTQFDVCGFSRLYDKILFNHAKGCWKQFYTSPAHSFWKSGANNLSHHVQHRRCLRPPKKFKKFSTKGFIRSNLKHVFIGQLSLCITSNFTATTPHEWPAY